MAHKMTVKKDVGPGHHRQGQAGQVIAAFPDRQKVIVEGVNLIRKNTKVNYQGQRGAKEGGIVTQEALIHVSNVQLIDPEVAGRPTRLPDRRRQEGPGVPG